MQTWRRLSESIDVPHPIATQRRMSLPPTHTQYGSSQLAACPAVSLFRQLFGGAHLCYTRPSLTSIQMILPQVDTDFIVLNICTAPCHVPSNSSFAGWPLSSAGLV